MAVCSALLCCASVVGCSSAADPDVTQGAIGPGSGARSVQSPAQEHDFGVILADGQTLRHEFELRNGTDRPVHVVGGAALIPCCSAIGPLPRVIPAHGSIKVVVSMKPGYQAGVRAARFIVETEDETQPRKALVLRATLFSAVEMKPASHSSTRLPVGAAGRQIFQLTTRTNGRLGRGLPDTVTVSSPLAAVFRGEATVRRDSSGLTAFAREVVVSIPPVTKPGPRRGELVFRWADGRTETRSIVWEITPRLQVSPSAVILPPTARPVLQRVEVVSDERAFTIEGVVGSVLTKWSCLCRRASRRQGVDLTLDASRATSGRAVDVTITTDHPDQPTVSLSVLVLRD
jgi:hypothetical protein